MRNVAVRLVAVLAGLLIGAAGVIALLYLWPFDAEKRTDATLAAADGRDSFSYFLDIPADMVFATHVGAFPMRRVPAGILLLSKGRLPNSLLFATRFRDAPGGDVVAFGTELEILHEDSSFLAGKLMTHTLWSIVEPGRGVLHLYQTENNWRLFKRVLLPMMVSGAAYAGEFLGVNTSGPRPGYRGLVVGGTGEFAALRGEFIEIGRLRRATPGGDLEGSMELRILAAEK